MYYDYAMAAPLMLADKKPSDMDVLILGMGTGTYATQCRKYLGDMNVEGVEIDEKITQLSRKYFSLSEDVPVTTYDGRAYLNAMDKKYDVIMVDAYQDITIPFQMSSVEFFTLVKDHLNEDGVMVVNMKMATSISISPIRLVRCLTRSIRLMWRIRRTASFLHRTIRRSWRICRQIQSRSQMLI